MELMVASSIGLLVMAAAMGFAYFSGIYLSGITAQTGLNQKGGNAIEFIQTKARLATSVAVDPSGNTLTFGFDDDPAVDSDGDGKTYNDKDHFEQFKFVGTNGTSSTLSTNSLVYIYMPKTGPTNQQVLIPAGVRNLPGFNIFSISNSTTVVVRFGITDGYLQDHYQSIDIQGTAVPLNRPAITNFISILPL
jgi:Tfp pilus assembly protein PilW